jgi:hypothetical protein
LAGTVPPYILTVPMGKDAVLLLVPVTAMPLASVRNVRLIEPWMVALIPRVPEPVCALAAPVMTKADSRVTRTNLVFM